MANAKVWGVAAFPERLAGPKFGGMIADRTRLVEGGVLNAMPRKVTVFAGTCLLSNMVLRDCRVASLLAMTHQDGVVVHQCPCAVESSYTRRSTPVKGTPHP